MEKTKELPSGYYAVVACDEDASKDFFIYKGEKYSVTPGKNLFSCLNDAYVASDTVPCKVLEGLDYESFDTPVIIMSGGEHLYNKGTPAGRSIKVDHSVTILGNNASRNPNLTSSSPSERPMLNPERQSDETILVSDSFWWGRFIIDEGCRADKIIFDGITLSQMCLEDMRRNTELDAYISFRNIIHRSPIFRTMYKILHPTKSSALKRKVEIINIRIEDMDDADYGNYFMTPAVDELILDGLVVANTTQIFGFTSACGDISNIPENAQNARITIKNSYFEALLSENSIRTALPDLGERSFEVTVDSCIFNNASLPGEPPLTLDVPTDKASVTVRNSTFINSHDISVSAIRLNGSGCSIHLENNTLSGFTAETQRILPDHGKGPDYVENHASDWESGCPDSHTVIGTDKADFSNLDKLYEGKRAYYGDLHVHTSCGGTSDGAYPMKDWPGTMDELHLDFAAVVDHGQMRGFFLPEWDDERFIIGTEPGTAITDLTSCRHNLRSMHYNMLFPHKYGLAMVMANFPEYKFKGDELTGTYVYARFTKERFRELVDYIQSIGGAVVHPHPKMMICSDDPLDYYIGEHTFLETLYDKYGSNYSIRNYDLWKKLLALGKHVYASGGSDTHGGVRNDTVSTFYTTERLGITFFETMKRGDFSVGAVGIQMAIDDSPMGSEISFVDGMVLNVRVGDFYKCEICDDGKYEIRIFTDKGLAYASAYNGQLTQNIALKVQDRAFYRVEIFDLKQGFVISHSNPIWLDKK
ncbi:MAG: hypothetical protein IJW06_03100 [Clostridia bacterium]|nr:hypothetical protein [Clostridia bacterium]